MWRGYKGRALCLSGTQKQLAQMTKAHVAAEEHLSKSTVDEERREGGARYAQVAVDQILKTASARSGPDYLSTRSTNAAFKRKPQTSSEYWLRRLLPSRMVNQMPVVMA